MHDAAHHMSKEFARKSMIPGERPMFEGNKEKRVIKTPLRLPPFEIPEAVQEAGMRSGKGELISGKSRGEEI